MTTTAKCTWYRDAYEDEYQACESNHFVFTEGFLADQGGFKFCPYCGLEIDAAEPLECGDCSCEFQPETPRQIRCEVCMENDEAEQGD